MKEHVFRFIGAVFLTILALMGIGAAIHILVTLPLGEKGPEWVGAIGTVATLIGTIWLATDGERRRKRESETLARLHGASMIARIMRVRNVGNWGLTEARAARQNPNEMPHPHVIELSRAFTAVSVWDAADLVPLVALYSDVARKLASAAGVFNAVKHYLEDTAKDYSRLSHDDRLTIPIVLAGLLNNVVTVLDDAATALGLQDIPPERLEEFFGPRP